jgi:GTP cyclohydrolase I
MSRFIQILNKYHEDKFIDQLEPFLKELKESLKAAVAYIDIQFPYFVKKHAPVSKIESLLSYNCTFNASYDQELKLWIGVVVPVTTLCPCSKEISQYGAHNQRSEITIKVCYNSFVWLEDLIDYAESSCSCEIYPLLKRIDEKYVTEMAYNNPMFVEDIVRDLTIKLEADDRITDYYIESNNFESIHNHNAYAMKRK